MTLPRRLLAVAIGLWFPLASMTHGVMVRCAAAASEPAAQEMPAHGHHHGASSDQAPSDDGPICPCSCVGNCHCASPVTTPGASAVVVAVVTAEPPSHPTAEPLSPRSAVRLLPFSTAPPSALPVQA
jgi:hypothetical protein